MEKSMKRNFMMSAPIFKKSQTDKVAFNNNIEKIFGKTVKEEVENSELKAELEKIKLLEVGNSELKAELEKVSGPKKELIEKIKTLEIENSDLKADLEKLLNEGEKK